MSRDPDDSSSDLERARALSVRLASAAAPTARVRPQQATGYVRFRAPSPQLGGAQHGVRPESRPVPTLDPELLTREGGWDTLLGWIRSFAEAESAFLIDVRGLLVASAGSVDKDRAEGMGARIVVSMEHADRMADQSARSRSLVIDFGERVVTALRVVLPDGQDLVLCVLAPVALPDDVRDEIHRALAKKVAS